MEYQLNEWYNVHEHYDNLEYVFQGVKWKESRVGLLMKYESGLIEFEPSPYLRGNIDAGREYFVDKFMLIKY